MVPAVCKAMISFLRTYFPAFRFLGIVTSQLVLCFLI